MYKLIYAVSYVAVMSGLSLVVMYLYWAVIQRWNEADQSLLFWYLPFLLFGIIFFGSGLRLKRWAQQKSKQQNGSADPQ